MTKKYTYSLTTEYLGKQVVNYIPCIFLPILLIPILFVSGVLFAVSFVALLLLTQVVVCFVRTRLYASMFDVISPNKRQSIFESCSLCACVVVAAVIAFVDSVGSAHGWYWLHSVLWVALKVVVLIYSFVLGWIVFGISYEKNRKQFWHHRSVDKSCQSASSSAGGSYDSIERSLYVGYVSSLVRITLLLLCSILFLLLEVSHVGLDGSPVALRSTILFPITIGLLVVCFAHTIYKLYSSRSLKQTIGSTALMTAMFVLSVFGTVTCVILQNFTQIFYVYWVSVLLQTVTVAISILTAVFFARLAMKSALFCIKAYKE